MVSSTRCIECYFCIVYFDYNDNNNINSNVLDSKRSERAIAATMDTNRRCSYFDMWKRVIQVMYLLNFLPN
jgi:hypothetical protein